jgi:hypothetical protein
MRHSREELMQIQYDAENSFSILTTSQYKDSVLAKGVSLGAELMHVSDVDRYDQVRITYRMDPKDIAQWNWTTEFHNMAGVKNVNGPEGAFCMMDGGGFDSE